MKSTIKPRRRAGGPKRFTPHVDPPLGERSPVDQKWLATRKKILQQIKAQVASQLGPEPKELSTYRRTYERNFGSRYKISNISELTQEILKARVIFGGDFHAFSQSQRTHLRVLRRLAMVENLTLALEALPSDDDGATQAYLQGKISEKKFLQKIEWNDSWGFDWDNYRPLFELARSRGFRVIGLSKKLSQGTENLKKRDRFAAQILAKELERDREQKIYVIFGDLHLAPSHLPKQLRTLSRKPYDELSIFLNSEKLYFKLASRGLENKVEIVRLKRDQFCIMGSPPWVQWQSYLMFLERSSDRLVDEDLHFDPTDEVGVLVDFLSDDLGVKLNVNDLSVYSSHDEKSWSAIRRSLSSKEFPIAERLMQQGKTLYFPKTGVGYLARGSVNHLAELAGQYMHAQLCARLENYWNMPDDFEKQIWIEAMGFFLSKLINHKRHSQTLTDLNMQLAQTSRAEDAYEVLKLTLDQRMSEVVFFHQMRKRARKFTPRRRTSYINSARILGAMMGERLYVAKQSRKLSMEQLVKFLRYEMDRQDFQRFYLKILWWLEPIHVELQSQKERL